MARIGSFGGRHEGMLRQRAVLTICRGRIPPNLGYPTATSRVSQYTLDAPAEQRVVTERGLTRLSYPRFDRCRRPLKRAIQYSRAPMIDPRGRGVLDTRFRLPEPPAGTLPPDADGRPASKLLSRGMTTIVSSPTLNARPSSPQPWPFSLHPCPPPAAPRAPG